MTILPELEQQLRDLASGEAPPQPPRRRWYAPPGAVVTTLAATAAVAIALVAIIALGHRSAVPSRPPTPAVPPAARALVSELAVLRRPQTPADLNSPNLDLFLQLRGPADPRGQRGRPIRSLIRLATVTPWGEKVYLVPFLGRGGTAALGLVADGGSCCATAAGIASNGTGSLSGGPSGNDAVVVVPDGVAKVSILLPRQGIPGERAYRHSLAITVPVHNNVAAFRSTRYADDIGFNHMVWYGPAGNVVRRIGDNSSLNRVVPPPRTSPPTALSRRAQADPATPNPVSVTPRIGGPHTVFTISFRLLISGAVYQYLFSGPGGPGCHGKTPTGAGGGVGGGPDDVRGQIWSQPFPPPPPRGGPPSAGTWCPGTFHVSVSAFGVPGSSGRFYPPFGAVTFTVKP